MLGAACVKTRQAGGKTKWDCPTCRGQCVPLVDFQESERQRSTKEAQSFFQRLPGAFAYPIGKGGTLLLILGTLLYLILDFVRYVARFAPGYGKIGLGILTVFSYGYLFAYMQKMVIATAHGEEHLPGWPEISEGWSDVTRPFWMFATTLVVCFGPAVGYMVWTAGADGDFNLFVFVPVVALGFLYFPMALLAVCMSDSVSGLNPLVVLPAIARMPVHYFAACVVLFVVVVLRFFSEKALHTVIPVPVVPTVLAAFLALYFLAVEMRILGLMYYSNRNRFGWFQ